jgi:hypothetical protein
MVAAYNLEAADDLSVPPKHPAAIWLRATKSGGTILPGAAKWELFTEYLQTTP